MIKLQHLNVVKYAVTEEQAQKLISKGFKVIDQNEVPEEVPEEPREEKAEKAKPKGKVKVEGGA